MPTVRQALLDSSELHEMHPRRHGRDSSAISERACRATRMATPSGSRGSKLTPTARALAECKRRGWPAGVVERYVSQTRRRHDLFGFIDLVALDGQRGVLGIQVTSSSNMSARVTKIQTECSERAVNWLHAGNRVQVWGFAKRGARGARKLWTLRVVDVDVDDRGRFTTV